MDPAEQGYRQFLNGDMTGMEIIVNEHYDGLTFYLNTILHNLTDAEELAEETLYLLMSHKPVFNGKSSFKTWLYAIGRNQACTYLKRRGREAALEPEAIEKMREKEYYDVEQKFLKAEQFKQLYCELSGLKKEYRQVIWLRYFEEMTGREIANVMGKTLFSVNHLLQKAKEELRKRLEKGGMVLEKS